MLSLLQSMSNMLGFIDWLINPVIVDCFDTGLDIVFVVGLSVNSSLLILLAITLVLDVDSAETWIVDGSCWEA